MNIEGRGYHQWRLEFEAALRDILGGTAPKGLLGKQEEDLKEEWFRGTAPQLAAREVLRSLILQRKVRKAPR